MTRLVTSLLGLALLALAGFAHGQSVTKVVFGTNWFAQAEHGGFYQAIAEGRYKKQGLDVEIKMGGPQVNGMQLLLANQLDMFMGFDIQVLLGVQDGLPLVTVAAAFQKDPAVIIAHPDIKEIGQLKGRPIFISAASNTTFWPWLRSKYAFTDDQKRPYSFSVQPFLVDKRSATQGYATSEPYAVEKSGVKPSVFLLADLGYSPYAQTIVVTENYLKKNPEVVRRFIQATAEGYKSYIGNPAPANALIKKANPQMEDDQIAFGLRKMAEFGIVTGGDAKSQGIMTMSEFMVGAGLLKPGTDYKKAYSLQFVREVRVLP
jgi:NitT/TauT family transport system substrate-binding protein